MRKRSRVEVIVDTLSEALKGANKTRIMYRANLNFLRFDRYFGELQKAGLVAVLWVHRKRYLARGLKKPK